ncbi:adenosylcobinamide-phosphate synthase CbiB [Phenylobacterium sp. Root700]|uniref:adenosylcobinamide-phosphate synthase CbiB n=1 Tax=Phenylobacterium sp. Root700 TaxID=1736591 RepID=UPI0006FF4F4B|nr:adenosylcobinamide-phosphate synthase CbiB [Phenylobacterium sp. Root700]KRB41967.1 adenosylcobinamide-phosphate synthase [Phenylobacterium sp. Root700]
MAADPWLVLAAAAVEGVAGYPRRLHAIVPHPVAWIGRQLHALERRLNNGGDLPRRIAGLATLLIVAGSAAGAGLLLDHLLAGPAVILAALLGSLGLAARSLYDHVAAVSRALGAADLPAARAAVAMIVGRDTETLDREGVAAAALESLAESFNDGVVAPLFWFLLGGLAGLFAYKAVNTADSIIGHREEPYRCFGWAAARTDDLMNLIPARIAGALIALVAGRGWATMLRDAGKHASPNSGWPEAAMAGALRVQLGGPASYDGVAHDRPTFGDGPRPSPLDLHQGLRLYLRACAILAAALILGGLAWPR